MLISFLMLGLQGGCRDVEDDLVVKVFDQSDEKAIGPGDREVLARCETFTPQLFLEHNLVHKHVFAL